MKPNIMTATATPTVGAICEMELDEGLRGPLAAAHLLLVAVVELDGEVDPQADQYRKACQGHKRQWNIDGGRDAEGPQYADQHYRE